jgi:methionyl-tRNA synthetase
VKYFEGSTLEPIQLENSDQDLITQASQLHGKVKNSMEHLKVAEALDTILTLSKRANKYIDETTPWILAKDQNEHPRLQTVLYHLLETIRICGVALKGFLPETAQKILTIINTQQIHLSDQAEFGLLEKNNDLHKENMILFERITPKDAMEAYQEILTPNVKEEVEIDYATIGDFSKLTLKVGEVLSCEKHPNANKLLVSQIDCGDRVHQIVSGIASFITPEEMVGKKVIVITNLKPIKLREVLSEGMLLVAENKKQNEIIEIKNLPKGSIVR